MKTGWLLFNIHDTKIDDLALKAFSPDLFLCDEEIKEIMVTICYNYDFERLINHNLQVNEVLTASLPPSNIAGRPLKPLWPTQCPL